MPNYVHALALMIAEKTYRKNVPFFVVQFKSLHNIFLSCRPEHQPMFSFQHGLKQYWIAKAGSLSVAVRYLCDTELFACSNLKEKDIKIKSMPLKQTVALRKNLLK